MPTIRLQSSDGEVFQVDVAVAKASGTIKTMVEELGIADDDVEIVSLPKVNAKTLRLVIEWATRHKNDPPAPLDDEGREIRSYQNSYNLTGWDEKFLKVDQGTLFELMLAANYLDVGKLLNHTCHTVAKMIRGRTAEQIRETFNIKNDFTPEEEDQVYRENEWCEH